MIQPSCSKKSRLDYKGGQFSLTLFLPAARSNLQRFQATLSAKRWGRWMRQFKLRPGTVMLPRFQVRFNANLHQVFEALGLGVLFDPDSAKLDRILSDGPSPFLTGAQHQAFVDLDEEDTEAAAVTLLLQAVSYTPRPPKVFLMRADRSFFFAIQRTFHDELLQGAISRHKNQCPSRSDASPGARS